MANRFPNKKERINFLKIESLEYTTIKDLIRAIGLPAEQLCLDCALLEPLKQKTLF